jgi:hypothetical protein
MEASHGRKGSVIGSRSQEYALLTPRKVAQGPPADAEREIACMEAVLVTLTKLLLEEQKTNNPMLFDRIQS